MLSSLLDCESPLVIPLLESCQSSPCACSPADIGSSIGDVLRLGVLDRCEDWRESSKEPRGIGERGRGLCTDMGSVPGTFGKEKERSEVGVESSMAAVLVEGV